MQEFYTYTYAIVLQNQPEDIDEDILFGLIGGGTEIALNARSSLIRGMVQKF